MRSRTGWRSVVWAREPEHASVAIKRTSADTTHQVGFGRRIPLNFNITGTRLFGRARKAALVDQQRTIALRLGVEGSLLHDLDLHSDVLRSMPARSAPGGIQKG